MLQKKNKSKLILEEYLQLIMKRRKFIDKNVNLAFFSG